MSESRRSIPGRSTRSRSAISTSSGAASHLVDKLVIGVTTNPSKEPMFSVAERLAMVRREVAGIPGNIEVVEFDSLLMDFAESPGRDR